MFLVILQQFIVAAKNVQSSTHAWLRSIYSVLSVITFDYEFIRPGCTEATIRFVDLYMIKFGFYICVFALFICFALVY